MSTIQVKFCPAAVGRQGTIIYQIEHEGKSRIITTGYNIKESEWDASRSMPKITKDERDSRLRKTHEDICNDKERLMRIIARLNVKGFPFDAADIAHEYDLYASDYTLFNYMQKIIDKFKLRGNERTAETYRSTLNSFKSFRDGMDIKLDCITPGIIEEYEAWQMHRGISANTSSFYMRIMRAVYNAAVSDGIIDDRRPFKKVYTGVDKTIKRALTLRQMRKIKSLDLSDNRCMEFARDVFLMSFCLRGMSFVDMAYLQKTDLRNGMLVYHRRKTGQLLTIAWTKEMQALIDKYPVNKTKYLLPIISKEVNNDRTAYLNASYNINRQLKKLGKMVNVPMPLTLYVARHSWASIAKASGIPISVISEGMGHDSEATTRIYLASLDTSVIDRANAQIIKSL